MDSINLTEWTTLYIKHKDVIAKKIIDVKPQKDHILFTYKDGPTKVFALETLAVPKIDSRAVITTLQTK